MTKPKSEITHIRWLVESRGKNNVAGTQLLELFETYPDLIRERPHALFAQDLVAIAFCLWRAAFLTETEGKITRKVDDAEEFLRKMLSDNTIAFAQDMQWREWSANFYIRDARLRLHELAKDWPELDLDALSPPKGSRSAKVRWERLHDCFAWSVSRLAADLETASKAKKNSNRDTT